MKLDHHDTPYTKINSKWIKDLNGTPKPVKLLKKTGESFLEIRPKAKATKVKMDK